MHDGRGLDACKGVCCTFAAEPSVPGAKPFFCGVAGQRSGCAAGVRSWIWVVTLGSMRATEKTSIKSKGKGSLTRTLAGAMIYDTTPLQKPMSIPGYGPAVP